MQEDGIAFVPLEEGDPEFVAEPAGAKKPVRRAQTERAASTGPGEQPSKKDEEQKGRKKKTDKPEKGDKGEKGKKKREWEGEEFTYNINKVPPQFVMAITDIIESVKSLAEGSTSSFNAARYEEKLIRLGPDGISECRPLILYCVRWILNR